MDSPDSLEDLCIDNNHQQLKKEIEYNPNLISSLAKIGGASLNTAADWGSLECVEVLIQAGANVNVRDEAGYTALMEACSSSHYDIVKLLLENGAEISHRDEVGRSAFDLALQFDDNRRVKNEWFHLFSPYADQFDEKDVITLKEHRLAGLYI